MFSLNFLLSLLTRVMIKAAHSYEAAPFGSALRRSELRMMLDEILTAFFFTGSLDGERSISIGSSATSSLKSIEQMKFIIF